MLLCRIKIKYNVDSEEFEKIAKILEEETKKIKK